MAQHHVGGYANWPRITIPVCADRRACHEYLSERQLAGGVQLRADRPRGEGDRGYALLSGGCEALALQGHHAGNDLPAPDWFQRLGVLTARLLWIVNRESFEAPVVGPNALRNDVYEARRTREGRAAGPPKPVGAPSAAEVRAQSGLVLGLLAEIAGALLPASAEAQALTTLAPPDALDRAVSMIVDAESSGALTSVSEDVSQLLSAAFDAMAALEGARSTRDLIALAGVGGRLAAVGSILCGLFARLAHPGVTPSDATVLLADAIDEARRIVEA
jgi:hypothetical protein